MKNIIIVVLFIIIVLLTNNVKNITTSITNKNKNDSNTWYIEIPIINLKEKIYNNDVDKHIIIIEPSNYPNIDKSTLILASHSGSGKYAYFNDLYKLSINDYIYIINGNKMYKYKLKDIYYQIKDGDVNIYKDDSKTNLVLITCTNNNMYTQTIYISELIK